MQYAYIGMTMEYRERISESSLRKELEMTIVQFCTVTSKEFHSCNDKFIYRHAILKFNG